MFDTACMLDEVFPEFDADFIDDLVLFQWIGVVRNHKILFVLIDKLRNGFLLKKIKCKVEKISKGILVSIPSPSPSVKIQIMCGKDYSR